MTYPPMRPLPEEEYGFYPTISSFFEAEGDFEENLGETRPAPSWIDEEEIDMNEARREDEEKYGPNPG